MQNLIAKLQTIFHEEGQSDLCNTIELRRNESTFADIRVFLKAEADAEHSSTVPLLNSIERLPEVASVKPKKTSISIRLTDDFIQSVGRELELARYPMTGFSSIGDTKRYLIGFLGPNTSKALHLGHLRNIVIGNALASAFTAAGVKTRSYSLVGDIGRNVCEAMAGYELLHNDSSPSKAGLKSDHFVGRCYQDYLNRNCDPVVRAGVDSDPCAREHIASADLADELLSAWRMGDLRVRNLWRWFHNMVEAGHDETLAQLGVKVDKCYYESEHLSLALDLINQGLKDGVLERLDDGMVVYNTGRKEFERIVLARSDGFPTEHGRILAVFHHILSESELGCTHIDWNGTEWEPAQTVLTDLMQKLSLIPAESTHVPVFHGMLLFDGEKMSSSQAKEPILVDDLIIRLRQSPQVAALVERSDHSVNHRVISDIILKGFFLSESIRKPLSYSWEKFMDARVNCGWLIAQAWCNANSDTFTIEDDDKAGSFAYRLAVMQAQGFPRILSNVVDAMTPESLVRYLIHFCEKYLAAKEPSEKLRRVALTVIGAALNSLGFATSADAQKSPAMIIA